MLVLTISNQHRPRRPPLRQASSARDGGRDDDADHAAELERRHRRPDRRARHRSTCRSTRSGCSGEQRVNVPGKFTLRVSSLEAEIPNVTKLRAWAIEVSYDPEGGAAQELVKINSATLLMPRFNIRGTIRPFDTALAERPGHRPERAA